MHEPDSSSPDPRALPGGWLSLRGCARLGTLAALSALLGWVYWPTLCDVAYRCWHDPQYNHGLLVPVFAGGLLWWRRGLAPAGARAPSWWGLLLLAAGVGVRLAGAYFYYNALEAVSLLPLVAGLFVLFGGWVGLRWSWPAIAFLLFMLPLPHRLHVALAPALQQLATRVSTFALQTLGYCAVADGTSIRMNEVKISVVQACSGLSMLMTFFALSTGLALVIRRPVRDRVAIVLSAIPVALVANVARITATGVLHKTVGSAAANAVFHDLAGWLMMPLALGLLGLELKVLSRLFVEYEPPAPLAVSLLPQPSGPARAGRREPQRV